MITKNFHLSTLVLFASCLAFLQAQDCNNPLLETFDLTPLPNPVSGATLPYCSNLQAGQTCCSNETVAGFQARLNDLTTRIQDAASARDRYIVQLKDQYSQQYQAAAGNLSLLASQISNIQSANAAIGDRIISQRDQIASIAAGLSTVDSNFQTDFQNYQNTRANCFNTLLKVQASAWCLACDPNYAALGVQSNGSINYSPNLCTTISQACFPFLDAADNENPLYRAQQSFQRLQNLLAYIANFTATGTIPTSTLRGDIARLTNATERTVNIPAGCTDAATCPWQCQNLFSGQGVLNEAIAANGAGETGSTDINFGTVGQAAANSRRMLQSAAVWNPDIESTRMTVVVVSDPANLAAVVADGSGPTVIIPVNGMRMSLGNFVIGLLIVFAQLMLLL